MMDVAIQCLTKVFSLRNYLQAQKKIIVHDFSAFYFKTLLFTLEVCLAFCKRYHQHAELRSFRLRVVSPTGRFAYGLFRLRSVRLRFESIRLRLICQFAYVLKHVLPQFIHLLYVRSRSDPSQSIQFLERDS